jgi:hypothetical protein
MRTKITLPICIALLLLAVQPVFAQTESEPVAEVEEPQGHVIDIAAEVSELLQRESVASFISNLTAGVAMAAATMTEDLQQKAYDGTLNWSNNLIGQILALMDDEGLAVLKDTEFGKNLIAWAQSLPATILEISKDPLQIGVFNTIISSVAMFSKWIIPIFSTEFRASFYAVLEQFPWVFARSPLTLHPILIATLEGIPVFIESMIPVFLTSFLGAVVGLTEFVPKILALDTETIASVFTTPVNTVMEILSIMRETAFHLTGGGLLALQNFVSLVVSSPRVAIALFVSLVLAIPVLLIDSTITFLSYIPGIVTSLVLSTIIGIIIFVVANDLVVFLTDTLARVVDPEKYIINPILRVLDLFDLESLRNLVGVFSEGVANLL